jgi:hypothetical protein
MNPALASRTVDGVTFRESPCASNACGDSELPAKPQRMEREATATALDSGLRRNDSNGKRQLQLRWIPAFAGMRAMAKGNCNCAGFRPSPE